MANASNAKNKTKKTRAQAAGLSVIDEALLRDDIAVRVFEELVVHALKGTSREWDQSKILMVEEMARSGLVAADIFMKVRAEEPAAEVSVRGGQ